MLLWSERMIAIELISEEIIPVEHTDTGDMALQWMSDYKVNHLSVMKNNVFVGVVSEVDLLDRTNLHLPLTELFDHLPRPYVNENAHIYDVLNLASTERLSIIPVLDEEENFKGDIDIRDLLNQFAATNTIKEQGGIIVLEMTLADYSLAHISQIVESENAKVLSAFLTSKPSSQKVELTLKINLLDVGRVIRALERYDYFVKASFQRDSYHDDLKERYDELMKYLNI